MTKLPIKTTRAYGKPDLSDWELLALDKALEGFDLFLRNAVAEAITFALNDEGTGVEWPAIWGKGDGRDRTDRIDPLTMYFTIAIGDGDDEHPVRSFNIRDALQSDLEQCREDGSYRDGMTRIRDAMRELVNEIDQALDSATDK